MKNKTIHASRNGSKRPLCEKRQGKTTTTWEDVTCLGCGKAALRAVKAAEAATAAEGHGRQRGALAALQQPRWWEGKTGG